MPNAQKFEIPAEKWSDKVGFYRDNSDVYIGSFKQTGIVHYIEDCV